MLKANSDSGSSALPVERRGVLASLGAYLFLVLAGYLAVLGLVSLPALGRGGPAFAVGAVATPLLGAWLLHLASKYLLPDRVVDERESGGPLEPTDRGEPGGEESHPESGA